MYLLTSHISIYFTFHEALWLPQWSRHADIQDGLTDSVVANLHALFLQIDEVREFFNLPIEIHCAYRSEPYNHLIGGAINSAHMGLDKDAAADFHVIGMECETARQMILDSDLLEKLSLRMENNGPHANWIHLDNRVPLPGHSRYFIP